MVKIIWTEFALDDLKSIHNYISKDSKPYADKFIEKLIKRVDQLEKFPNSGRITPEFDSKIIRELIEGNYRIVYKETLTTLVSFVCITQPDDYDWARRLAPNIRDNPRPSPESCPNISILHGPGA